MNVKKRLTTFLAPDFYKISIALVGIIAGTLALNVTLGPSFERVIGFPIPIWYRWYGGCPQAIGTACAGGEIFSITALAADIIFLYVISAAIVSGYRRWNT